MNAMIIATRSDNQSMTYSRLAQVYLEEARSECLRYLRMPSFMLPLLLFPGLFYVLFGVAMAPANGHATSRYLLASYTVFGVMIPGLYGFGVSLAAERGNGLLTLKRALPMPPAAYVVAKTIMAMAAASIVVCELLLLSLTVGHVSLSAANIVALLATGVFGTLPFGALGLWIGTLLKDQSAPAIINAVYLPMAFLSGLWLPLAMLPTIMQRIAPIWPSYHLNAIALDVVGMQHTAVGGHAAVLAGYGCLFLALSVRRLRRHG